MKTTVVTTVTVETSEAEPVRAAARAAAIASPRVLFQRDEGYPACDEGAYVISGVMDAARAGDVVPAFFQQQCPAQFPGRNVSNILVVGRPHGFVAQDKLDIQYLYVADDSDEIPPNFNKTAVRLFYPRMNTEIQVRLSLTTDGRILVIEEA